MILVLVALSVPVLVLATMMRPRFSLAFAVIASLLEALDYLESLRALAGLCLCVAILSRWGATDEAVRRVSYWILGWAASAISLGWVLSPVPSLGRAAAANLVFTLLVSVAVIVLGVGFRGLALVACGVGIAVSVWLSNHDVVEIGRASGLWLGENANSLGMLAGLSAVTCLAVARTSSVHYLARAVLVGAAFFSLYGVVLSGSRGAIAASLVSLAVLSLRSVMSRSDFWAVSALGLVALTANWVMVPLLTRLLRLTDRPLDSVDDFGIRGLLLREAIKIGLDNPIAGIGFARMELVSPLAQGQSAHNVYVGMFAATGLLPPTIFISIVLMAFLRARKAAFQNLLPLVVFVIICGFTLEWYNTALLGPLFMVVIALALTRDPALASDEVGSVNEVAAGPHK